MWYVRPAKPHISLRIRAVWSEPFLVAWIFYDCLATDWKPFGVSKLKRRLQSLVQVYTCQNIKLLEISIRGSIVFLLPHGCLYSVSLPRGSIGNWYVIVIYPEHTHLLISTDSCIRSKKRHTNRNLPHLVLALISKLEITLLSKICLKRPLRNRQKKDLNDKWLLNEGRKYCRMLLLEKVQTYRQIVGIPMGTYCAPLVADLFLYCYERDFM